jgi:hypothetical protein
MAHWAEIDENNIVLQVTVGDNNDPAGDEGYQWLIDNLGGTWIKTSYNGNIRKNFAGVGFTYDELMDAFIPPMPLNVIPDPENEGMTIEVIWNLNKNTCQWELTTFLDN